MSDLSKSTPACNEARGPSLSPDCLTSSPAQTPGFLALTLTVLMPCGSVQQYSSYPKDPVVVKLVTSQKTDREFLEACQYGGYGNRNESRGPGGPLGNVGSH